MPTNALARGTDNGFLADDNREGLAYLHAWSDRTGVPCLIVAPDGQLIWGNQIGHVLLDDGDRLTDQSGRLQCSDKSQQAELMTFLEQAADKGDVWVYLDAKIGNLLIRGEPIRRNGQRAAGLMIHPVGEATEAVWADLTRIFPLTRAEAAVVRNAAAGARADAIAADLGVSLETVRTHFRRIYAKLGVGSREQLFALVTPYRLP